MRVNGFSKISKKDKINWLLQNYLNNDAQAEQILKQYWHNDEALQGLHDGFIENTISNFYLPYAIAPNFVIDNVVYALPMVIEESSVVAAAANAAKFWADRGGFTTTILGNIKKGHIHFTYDGDIKNLISFFRKHRSIILDNIDPLQQNMKQRGGGVMDINLIDKTNALQNYYQIELKFNTADSMGANFINTVLEETASHFKRLAQDNLEGNLTVIMSILTNYNPECVVRAEVNCKISDLPEIDGSSAKYAEKFITAIKIAEIEPYRAVTHNKGIMNGVDALVLATGNDFRAVEAGVHAYAAKNGNYTSLSHAEINDDKLKYWVDLPLTLGTVGGLTGIHPLVKFSLQLLQNPSAEQLMRIVAASGLAQNFAALNSLITHGIQKGHMKMHLNNLLNFLNATEEEKQMAKEYFEDKKVNFSELKTILKR